MMKQNSFFLMVIVILIGLSCSKSDDPASAKGCQVTFKSTNVSLPDLVCTEISGSPSASATNLPGEQELALVNGATIKNISFVVSGDPDSYYSSTFASTPPTITIDGKKWTFSGTLVNNLGDSGTISGTCTCSN